MIKRIRIRNFKSLRDVTVDLGPVTVLIGRSGTGKSNFVQALRFLRDVLIRRNYEQAAQALGGLPWLACATAPRTDPLAFDVTFSVKGIEGDLNYAVSFARFDETRLKLKCEGLWLDDRPIFSQKEQRWEHEPALVSPPKPGEQLLELMYGVLEAKVAHLALTRGIGCYDFPGNVGVNPDFDPAKGGALQDSGGNFIGALDAISNNLDHLDRIREIASVLAQLNRGVSGLELNATRSRVLVAHQAASGKLLTLDLAQESEGFRRCVAHLLAIYQEPAKQVLIFEEPEKGIYPGALAALAEELHGTAEHGRSQVILTTQSPQLLGLFGPDEIRVVEMDDFETRIGPVSPADIESVEERLITTDEFLTVREAQMASPSIAG